MEVTVGRLQLIAFNHPVKWTNCTGGALAIPDTALAAHFDFENRLAVGVIFEDFDIAIQKYPELVQKYFTKCIPINDHKFAALHYAIFSGGTF